ncbi:MAG: MscL family protein [Acidobacteria bacterium]|nr:MscL family protein [Acidobacteriota bacterium]
MDGVFRVGEIGCPLDEDEQFLGMSPVQFLEGRCLSAPNIRKKLFIRDAVHVLFHQTMKNSSDFQVFFSPLFTIDAGAVTLNFGLFINTVIRFLIIGFSIFLVVKWVNALKAKDEEAPAEPTTKECPLENI